VSGELERDLGAWARGDLDRERLLAGHGSEAAGPVALHERLAGLAVSIPVPDADAGWASLHGRLEPPAHVVPRRRPDVRRRTVPVLVAAALMLAAAAFAAARSSTHRDTTPAPSTVSRTVAPPTASGPIDTNGRVRGPQLPSAVAGGRDQRSGPSAVNQGSGVLGDASGGVSMGGSPSNDDPSDRDHGTGNDGAHDDHGSGNDGRSGTLPRPSHGSHGKGH
jgi:hypothetical protein